MGYLSSFLAIKHDIISYKTLIYIALLGFQRFMRCCSRPQGYGRYGLMPFISTLAAARGKTLERGFYIRIFSFSFLAEISLRSF